MPRASARPARRRPMAGGALVRLLLVVAGTLVALGAAVAWLAGTSAGTAWLLAQIPGLRISAPSGALAGGPFSARRVQWEGDAGRLVVEDLRWADLRWSWRPHAQAWVGVDLVEARAARVEWRSARRADAPAAPLQPPADLRLPVQVRLLDLRAERIEVDDLPPLERLQLGAELGADEGRVHRVSQLALALQALRLSARGEIGAAGDLPLQLRLDAESPPDRAPAWTGWLELAGPLQRLQALARVDVAEPAAGADLRATLAPFAAWPLLDLALESRDLDLAALAPGAPTTRLGGRVDVRTSGLDAPIEADVALVNASPGRWDRGRLPLARLEATVRGSAADRSTVELRRLDARLDGGGVAAGRVAGQARWQRDRLTLDLTAADLRPARLDARAPDLLLGGPLALTLGGLPTPEALVAGGAAPPAAWQAQATLQITGRHLGWRDTPPVRLAATADGSGDGAAWRFEVRRLDASAGPARAGATATVAQAADGARTLATRGEIAGLDPLAWWPAPAGTPPAAWRAGPHRLDARWDADLTLPAAAQALAARGRAEVTIADSVLAGLPLNATATWRHPSAAEPSQVQADVALAGQRVRAEGRLGPGRTMAWTADVDAPRLAAWQPLRRLAPALDAWLPSAGSATGRVEAGGEWPQLRTRGELQVRDLAVQEVRLASARARWNAALDPLARPDEPLLVELDVDRVAQGERRLDRLRARVDGRWSAHRVELDASAPLRPPAWVEAWTPPAAPAEPAATDGTALRLRADGRWARAATGGGEWRATVDELRVGPRAADGTPRAGGWLQAGGLALLVRHDAAGAPLAVRAEPGRLQVLDAALRWTELQWSAGGGFAADAEIEPIAVAPWLARAQPQFGWEGDLTLGATLRLRLRDGTDGVEADVVVERRGGDLRVRDNGNRLPFGFTDLRLALTAREGTWTLTQGVAAAQVGVLAGAQVARVAAPQRWPDAATPLEGVLELRVDHLGTWAPWAPPGWRFGGSLRTSASIGGRLGAPEYVGEVVGRQLAVRNLLEGVDVRDGELLATLRGADARVETLRLRAGEGTVDVTGGASFGAQPQARLELVADRFQVLSRVDRRVAVSGRADMLLDLDAIRVDGRFGVDRGLIDFTRSDAPTLDPDVTVVRRGEVAPEPGPAAAPPPRRRVAVEIAIDLGRDLRLRGRGLDTLLRGNLVLTTPGGRPALAGTVRAEDGSYKAYGQNLRIERGSVIFTGAPDNPRLDILAIRPNLEVVAGVEIGGTAQSPRVRLFSDPAMADAEVLAWLILGRAPTEVGRAEAALLQGAAMALLAGEGEGPTANLLRTFGIDQLTVAPTGNGDVQGTVVTVGKQVGRNLFVAYERGINATSGSWQLIYRVARRITVRAQTGEDTAIDVIWSWRWN